MHIMVFGGSFDPPHIGHIKIVQHVLENKLCDEVWFVPCGSHPFDKNMSPPEYRLSMLKLLHITNTRIDPYEIHSTEKSYSYKTLRYFSQKYPEHTFSFLIGSDQLPNFHKWHEYQHLLESYSVYVYPRKDYPFNPLYPNMIPLSSMPMITISSTQIREHMKKHEDLTSQTTKDIIMYIKKNALYNA